MTLPDRLRAETDLITDMTVDRWACPHSAAIAESFTNTGEVSSRRYCPDCKSWIWREGDVFFLLADEPVQWSVGIAPLHESMRGNVAQPIITIHKGATLSTLTGEKLAAIRQRLQAHHEPLTFSCGEACFQLAHHDARALLDEVERLRESYDDKRQEADHLRAQGEEWRKALTNLILDVVCSECGPILAEDVHLLAASSPHGDERCGKCGSGVDIRKRDAVAELREAKRMRGFIKVHNLWHEWALVGERRSVVAVSAAETAAVISDHMTFVDQHADQLTAGIDVEARLAEVTARVADNPTPDPTEHDCGPNGCGDLYYCPTSGETESPCHGGFDVCCDRPDLHQPSTPDTRAES